MDDLFLLRSTGADTSFISWSSKMAAGAAAAFFFGAGEALGLGLAAALAVEARREGVEGATGAGAGARETREEVRREGVEGVGALAVRKRGISVGEREAHRVRGRGGRTRHDGCVGGRDGGGGREDGCLSSTSSPGRPPCFLSLADHHHTKKRTFQIRQHASTSFNCCLDLCAR